MTLSHEIKSLQASLPKYYDILIFIDIEPGYSSYTQDQTVVASISTEVMYCYVFEKTILRTKAYFCFFAKVNGNRSFQLQQTSLKPRFGLKYINTIYKFTNTLETKYIPSKN